MSNVKSRGFLIVVGLILITVSLIIGRLTSFSPQGLSTHTGREAEKKLSECLFASDELLQNPSPEEKEKFYRYFSRDKIGLYLFKRDSLVFWNNAQIPVSDSLIKQNADFGLIALRQGYYLFSRKTEGLYTAFALSVIKTNYDFQNNHLKNVFSEWTKIPESVSFSEKTGTVNDVQVNGKKLFSLRATETSYNNHAFVFLCGSLLVMGSSILFLSLLLYFKKHTKPLATLAGVAVPAVAKLIMIFAPFPKFLSGTFLYDVRIFGNAQSFFNGNLADVLFNSAALLYISLLFYFHFKSFRSRTEKNIKLFILFAFVALSCWQFNHSIRSLVSNSTLSFDFLNLFNLRPAAILSIFSIAVNCIALFLTAYQACTYFNKQWWRSLLEFCGSNLLVCITIQLVSPGENFLQNYWLLFFSVLLFLIVKLNLHKFSLALGVLVAAMSIISSAFFTHFIQKNQKQDLQILKEKLGERKDVVLENEFAGLPAKIEKDNNIKALVYLLPDTKKEVEQLLKQRYFKGYFNTYNVDISMFDRECRPLLNPSQPILLNEGFFEDKIRFYSDSTFSKELFFIEKYKKNTQYIAKIKLEDKNLYLLFEPKQFAELGSFPDLLLDQSQQNHQKLKNFSYAIYRAGQKTAKYGDCDYPFYFIDSASLSKSLPGYTHHYFITDDASTHIIISEKKKNWRYYFTYNSYLFLFFSIISFFSYYIYSLFFTANFKTSSLTRKIQTIIIVLLLLAMSAVGVISGNLVTRQFESDNVKQLQEKTQSIIGELSEQIKTNEIFSDTQKDAVNQKLQEFAHLYNSDISLFTEHGKLYNTSQPKLYELGLADSLANPEAYFKIRENKTSSYHVTEKAGSLDYISLYTPVFDENKKLSGFINLPYFAKQSDLTNELSSIISALINVYIILFILSIIAGLILAGYITKPLRLIQKQIAGITLGKQNETLKWTSNDEVGKLVSEYNNMLLKLEDSANLLAQNEREGAWREMAKQVAHEIKNPLTPMKLNLQYLQHLMKNSPQDFNERFEKASASIIEQIDTLAGIATEFSNFAKLPGTQLQEINLLEIIHSSVNLFKREHAAIKVHISFPEMNVIGDKEQAIRIFNNIIKNAIQATSEVEHPQVIIGANETDETFIVFVRDNGCGIPEQMQEKIFTPNFTTKSTGSGLGLAMVKNIVTNFGGRIWFTSKVNEGAEFFIEFRKIQVQEKRQPK